MGYEFIQSTLYAFGSPCNGQYGHLILSEGGGVKGYKNPREVAWRLEGDELCFLGDWGGVSSRFRYIGERYWNGCVENGKWPLYLIPALSLDVPKTGHPLKRNIFVNSIPKSGTYFLEGALLRLGYTPTRLHLGGDRIVDDYRGLPDAEVHVNPPAVRLELPVALTAAMGCGGVLVGHVEHRHIVEEIKGFGTDVISLVRNLRDVLVSLYRFKLHKVKPVNREDESWRTIEEKCRFLAFLYYFLDKDISHIKAMCQMLIGEQGPVLRYEQMLVGLDDVSDEVKSRLEDIFPGFLFELSRSLKKVVGTANPTYSGRVSNWESVWSADAEAIFQAAGLFELNESLGYKGVLNKY